MLNTRGQLRAAATTSGLMLLLALSAFVTLPRGITGTGVVRAVEPDLGVVYARARISIPFGIETPLTLSADHRTVDAQGHGGCSPVGAWFELELTITQMETGAVARGRTEGQCTEALQHWSMPAVVSGTATLVPGPAQAGYLVVSLDEEGGWARQWLHDIELAEAGSGNGGPILFLPLVGTGHLGTQTPE